MKLLRWIGRVLAAAFEGPQDVDPAVKPLVEGYIPHADGSRQRVTFRL